MGLDMYIYTNSKEMSKHINADGDFVNGFYEENGIVAYWHKANAIHRWFVEKVQGGVDDCGTHEIEMCLLYELLDTVDTVLASTVLVDGKVRNGRMYNGREFIDCLADGKVLEDTSVAEFLLPTQGGCFFGYTDYDQYYWEDLTDTRDMLGKILGCIECDDCEDWHFKGEDDWNLTLTYRASCRN